MRSLILILILLSSTVVVGQSLNYKQVDSSTYQLYLQEDWKNLIQTGKAGLEEGIDYYYLQMRIAYAYYTLGKYRKSLRYYKHALNHNSKDEIALEYMYYAYKYGGRYQDAVFLSSHMAPDQKIKLGIPDSVNLLAFGINHSYAFSDANSISSQITEGVDPLIPGIQKSTNSLHNLQLNVSHKLGNRIILSHRGAYLYKNEFSLAVANGRTFLSPEQAVNQYEYSLNASVLAADGFLIIPGIHYVQTKVPLFSETSYGEGMGLNRVAVDEIVLKSLIQSLLIQKQSASLDLGMSYAHHNLNDIATHQAGVHLSIYPFANLNLYIGADSYFQFYKYNAGTSNSLIIKPTIGGKIFKNLWIEIAGSNTDQFNFYDIRNQIAYNNIEKIGSSLEINAIIPLYKIHSQIFFTYKYRSIDSWFFPNEDLLNPINKHTYTSQLITGGIQWKR